MLVVSYSGVCRCTYVIKINNQQTTTATRADKRLRSLDETLGDDDEWRDVCRSNAFAADRDKFANDLIRMLIVECK